VKGLVARGHDVLFLERDVPWYAKHRDMPVPPFGSLALYRSFDELRARFATKVRSADAVIVGSYVPEGVAVGRWAQETARGPVAFYDIDTPVTLAKLAKGDFEYLAPELIPDYDLYLSFTGGPTLRRLESEFGAPAAHALYCSVDPDLYGPTGEAPEWDLGYLGTYSDDRQPVLDRLLLEPARRRPDLGFVVAGPQYPASIRWPANVARIEHLAPPEHPGFYARSRWTLNVTRAAMVAAGWSPSVRLFEAAACGAPIVSDSWPGLLDIFPAETIRVVGTREDVLDVLTGTDEAERRRAAAAAREHVLARHSGLARAAELEACLAAATARLARTAAE
jgi:spore maturation protein CgeB